MKVRNSDSSFNASLTQERETRAAVNWSGCARTASHSNDNRHPDQQLRELLPTHAGTDTTIPILPRTTGHPRGCRCTPAARHDKVTRQQQAYVHWRQHHRVVSQVPLPLLQLLHFPKVSLDLAHGGVTARRATSPCHGGAQANHDHNSQPQLSYLPRPQHTRAQTLHSDTTADANAAVNSPDCAPNGSHAPLTYNAGEHDNAG